MNNFLVKTLQPLYLIIKKIYGTIFNQNFLFYLGKRSLSIMQELGENFIFLFMCFLNFFNFPLSKKRIFEQIYFIGSKSIFVICLTGVFTGMVLGMQGYNTLVKFGSTGFLGAAVSLTLIKELGPVLSAIMIVARAGSSITAEIGIMRISEQIDALQTMSINPIKFLVTPKMIAALISFPLLTSIFDLIGIIGGYLTGSILLNLNSTVYFQGIQSSVEMSDIAEGLLKSLVFAVIVISISCYQGYYTHTKSQSMGSKGVSVSTTKAVVYSCVLIFIFDYILTSFLIYI